MTEQEIRQIVNTQRAYFYTGATLPLASRIKALEKLQACIREKEDIISEAIRKDLGKSGF